MNNLNNKYAYLSNYKDSNLNTMSKKLKITTTTTIIIITLTIIIIIILPTSIVKRLNLNLNFNIRVSKVQSKWERSFSNNSILFNWVWKENTIWMGIQHQSQKLPNPELLTLSLKDISGAHLRKQLPTCKSGALCGWPYHSSYSAISCRRKSCKSIT